MHLPEANSKSFKKLTPFDGKRQMGKKPNPNLRAFGRKADSSQTLNQPLIQTTVKVSKFGGLKGAHLSAQRALYSLDFHEFRTGESWPDFLIKTPAVAQLQLKMFTIKKAKLSPQYF